MRNFPEQGMPQISIITIFFNAQKYLQEAIQSVLRQTCEDWELLLVDDGSSDSSTIIAQNYAKQYPGKIYYLEHEGHKNLGMSTTRNLGIRHAKGKYIAFIDSDDVWLPHKLTDQIQILENNPDVGMVCGAIKYWYSWNTEGVFKNGAMKCVDTEDIHKKDLVIPIGAPQDTLIKAPQIYPYVHPFGTGMSPTPSDFMVRKEIVDKVGGFEERFKDQYQLFEDQGFLNKVYLHAHIFVSSKNWILYRRHPDSISSKVVGDGQFSEVKKYFLAWFEGYLIDQGQQGSKIWGLVQEALSSYKRPNINMPKVSAIIIFFNAKKFIDEAIRSVLSQTFSSWELLLADDGSTDGSTAIAKKYVGLYPDKIRYLEHPEHKNHGMSATRNFGLRHAQGEYIAFLDADDVWLPQKLERQVAILNANPRAGMVYGPSFYWHGWTANPDDLKRDEIGKLGVTPNTLREPPELMSLYLTSGGEYVPGTTGGQLMRKSALESVGGYEENFKGMYEDQVLLAKMVLSYPVYVDEMATVKYRQHSDSACNKSIHTGNYKPGKPHKAEAVYYKWLSRYIAHKGIRDHKLVAALKDRMLSYEHPAVKKWGRLLHIISEQRRITTIDLEKAYVISVDHYEVPNLFEIIDSRPDKYPDYLLKDSYDVQFLKDFKDKNDVTDEEIKASESYRVSSKYMRAYGIYNNLKDEASLLRYCRSFLNFYRTFDKKPYTQNHLKYIPMFNRALGGDPPVVVKILNSDYCMVLDGHHRLSCLYVLGEKFVKARVEGVIKNNLKENNRATAERYH